MLKLQHLKFLQQRISSDYDLDLNYSTIPTMEVALVQPKYPFNSEKALDAYHMLEIWWELDSLVKSLEIQKSSFGQIAIALKPPVAWRVEE